MSSFAGPKNLFLLNLIDLRELWKISFFAPLTGFYDSERVDFDDSLRNVKPLRLHYISKMVKSGFQGMEDF